MAAHAHYENDSFDDATVALDRFIQLHPGSPDIPFAYYLKALTYYMQITEVGRDQRTTQLSSDALTAVAPRFPGTDSARSATLNLDLTHLHLDVKEMAVGPLRTERRWVGEGCGQQCQ